MISSVVLNITAAGISRLMIASAIRVFVGSIPADGGAVSLHYS